MLGFFTRRSSITVKKQSTKLDLCFAVDEAELRQAWDEACALEGTAALDGICAVLWRCAERPSAAE